MVTYRSTEPWPKFPKPLGKTTTTTTEISTSQGPAVNFPQSSVGGVVPWVLGRHIVRDPNVIWYGNLKPITETTTEQKVITEKGETGIDYEEEITTTETIITTTIVGYYLDIALGICLGPGTVLKRILVDDVEIWNGSVGPERAEITIGTNDTAFSGSEVVFHGGNFDQSVEPDIDQADFPAHVGTAWLLIKNFRADMQIGALSFEVVRTANPLGLSAANNLIGDDVNVISAMVEVITNPWGAGGLDISNIDTTVFSAMAVTCIGEGNVVSMRIDQETRVADLIKTLAAQAACAIYQDPETGKLTGNLVRATQINKGDRKRFHPRNATDFRDWKKGGWSQTIEVLRAEFPNRENNYEMTPVVAQNAANVASSGRGKRNRAITYPFVPTVDLAIDLVARDLTVLSVPNYSFTIESDRDGATVRPGEIVVVTWPQWNLLNLPVVAEKIRKQTIDSNKVTITVSTIQFAAAGVNIVAGADPYDPDILPTPRAPTEAVFKTAPYWITRARAGVDLSWVDVGVYPLVLAKPFNDVQFSFDAFVTNMGGTATKSQILQDGIYATFCELADTINWDDALDDGIIAAVDVENVVNGVNLRDIAEAGVKAGHLFLLIDDEILSFESVTDNGAGSYTLNNVHRALLDTVPGDHTPGSDCYIINNNFRMAGGIPFRVPLGYTPDWELYGNLAMKRGQSPLSVAGWTPGDDNRTLAPLRPHNTKINGYRSNVPLVLGRGDEATITWAIRTRAATAVKLQLDSSETGEASQVHRVYLEDSANTVHDLGVTVDATTDTLAVTLPEGAALGSGEIWVAAESNIGGVARQSLYEDRLPVDLADIVDAVLSEDGEHFILDESGTTYLQEE